MSQPGRSTPVFPCQHGVSRIFKQSVKQLGHKDSHPTLDSLKGNTMENNTYNTSGSDDVGNLNQSSSIVRKGGFETGRSFIKKDCDKLPSRSDSKNSSKRPYISSLPSTSFKAKQPSRIHSDYNYKGRNYTNLQRESYYRYKSSRVNYAYCKQRYDRDVEVGSMKNRSVPKTTINHFTEDWTSDISDEGLTDNVPENRPLQSTPKKHAEGKCAEKTLYMSNKQKKRNFHEEIDRLSTLNERKTVTDVKNANNNIDIKDELPLDVNRSDYPPKNNILALTKQLKETNESLKVNDETEMFPLTEMVVKTQAVWRSDMPFDMKNSLEKGSMSENYTFMKDDPIEKFWEEKNKLIELHNEAGFVHKIKDNVVMNYFKNEDNTSDLKKITPTVEGNLPSQHEDRSNGEMYNKGTEICNGKVSSGKDCLTLEHGFCNSRHKHKPLKGIDNNYQKFKGNNNDQVHNEDVRYPGNHRKSPGEWKSNLPPRFLRKAKQQHTEEEVSLGESTTQHDSKKWRKPITPLQSEDCLDKNCKPNHGLSVGHPKSESVRNVNQINGYLNESICRSNFRGSADDLVNIKKGKDFKQQNQEGFVDTWVVPCSEDWMSELNNVNYIKEKSTDVTNKHREDESAKKDPYLQVEMLMPLGNMNSCDKKDNSSEVNQELCTNASQTLASFEKTDIIFDMKKNHITTEYGNSIKEVSRNIDDLGVEESKDTEKKPMSTVQYLPPSPPCSEAESVDNILVVCDKEDYDTDSMNNCTNNQVLEFAENNSDALETGQDFSSKDVNNNKSERSIVIKRACLGSETSEADVSELPSDEVADMMSSCSEYMKIVNQRGLDSPVVANSQEGSLDMNDGCGNIRDFSVSSVTNPHSNLWKASQGLCNAPQSHLSTLQGKWDMSHSHWNMPEYGVAEYDDRDWWNMQYDATYWNWYYYMYMESCRHTVSWQKRQQELGVTGGVIGSKNIHVIEQEISYDVKTGLNQGEVVEPDVGKMTTLNESLQSDFVTERTNDWVNSQVPEPLLEFDQQQPQDLVSTEDMSCINVEFQIKPISDVMPKYPEAEEASGDDFGTYENGNVRTDQNANCVRTDQNGSVSNTLQRNFSRDTIDADHTKKTCRRWDREFQLPSCNCVSGDVQFVMWRLCNCCPPRIHGVYSDIERNADQGYCSYESTQDHEDVTFLRKRNESGDGYHSPYIFPWKPTLEGIDCKKNDTPLYEHFVGSALPQTGVQQVYMMHSSSSKRPGFQGPRVLPNEESTVDNAENLPNLEHVQGTDENGNRLLTGERAIGKQKKIVDGLNQEFEASYLVNPETSSIKGGHCGRPPSASNVDIQRNSMDQEISGPMMQSGAHLSDAVQTLNSAEKTNSKLGKSFNIIRNAIFAIKQYTDQLKSQTENVAMSKETVLSDGQAQLNESNRLEKKDKKTELQNSTDESSDKDVVHFSKKDTVREVRPAFKPFGIHRRERYLCGSSSGPLSESSDDICKDSVLSQSPNTRTISTSDIQSHYYGSNNIQHNKPVPFGHNTFTTGSQKCIPKHSINYRGGEIKPSESSVSSAIRPDGHSGSYNKDIVSLSDIKSSHLGSQISKSPYHGPVYRPLFNEPSHLHSHPLFDDSQPATAKSFASSALSVDNNMPSIYSADINKYKDNKGIQRRKNKLVDYGDSDSSLSQESEIKPFDVNSLSGDFNPKTKDNKQKSTLDLGRPKKLKHDTTSDEDNTLSPTCHRQREQLGRVPVSFMNRPRRKLTHKQLKNLPTDDLPSVTFVRSSTAQKKYQNPPSLSEMISSTCQHDSNEKKNLINPSASATPPINAIEMPSLPPLPPFPQSQFWSMYLPKYNSALTGKQEGYSEKSEEKFVSTPPVTPELNRAKSRRSWGWAGCEIGSPSDTDSDSSTRNGWKISFKRFHSFGVKYIDTHCHLDFLFKREGFYGNLKDYMGKWPELFPDTFEGCVAVFCNPMTFNPNGGLWREVAKEDNVWIAMGCHPKMATDFSEAAESGLRQCLKHNKCIALGEIGLDYSGNFQQYEEVQKTVFRKQLAIALEMNKPLVLHCRDAEEDCLDILKEIVPRDYKIHCHCFTGYYYNAKLWMDAFPNLFIGVTPLVTYRTAKPSHDLARHIPLNRLLLETDAPYFVPNGVPKDVLQLSNPGLAVTVAKEIAQYQELPVAAVLRHCRLNTKFMYGI